jgi:molybdopterin converting factor small subunit
VKILFYGRLADAIGRHVEIDAPQPCPVADIRLRLAARYPEAAVILDRSRACIASAVVADNHVAALDAEVEFLPPVSGG